MHIVVVHQYFLMPGMPGGSRFNELTAHWKKSGHDVTVIAGNLDYTSGSVPQRYGTRWITEEEQDGITVLRCRVPQTYNKSYLGRAVAFGGFTAAACAAIPRVRRPDVIIATSPALTVAIPGWLLAHTKGGRIPWVFEIRDLWPESAVTTGVLKDGAPLTRLLYGLERWACLAADKINVLTPAFEDDLVRRGLATHDKICFVPNGVDPDEFVPGPRDNAYRREMGFGDRFVVLYAGAHGRANALGQLVDAAELLRDRPDILLVCVGNGPDKPNVVARAKERNVENLRFLDAQPKTRMPEVINAIDVGAAVLQNNPTFRTVYPNKVFDYMSCARPVLLAIDGVAREMVCDQARAGVFVEPENPRAIADAVLSLAADAELRRRMGESGRAWVSANVSRPALADRYLKILGELQLAG